MKWLFIAVLFLPFLAVAESPLASVEGVASVKDGDTLMIGPVEVRFGGIDAPEHDQACRQVVEGKSQSVPAGEMATAALKELAEGKPTRCEIFENKTTYNRVIAECSVGGVNLSREMVRRGWAYAYVRFSSAYLADEMEARAKGRGIHAMKCQTPAYFRCRNYKNLPASECLKLTRKDYYRP